MRKVFDVDAVPGDGQQANVVKDLSKWSIFVLDRNGSFDGGRGTM
jgi:hypothetical protein